MPHLSLLFHLIAYLYLLSSPRLLKSISSSWLKKSSRSAEFSLFFCSNFNTSSLFRKNLKRQNWHLPHDCMGRPITALIFQNFSHTFGICHCQVFMEALIFKHFVFLENGISYLAFVPFSEINQIFKSGLLAA